MKFSEIDQEQWVELQPYLDTCLLPITGLTGKEQPFEATEWLERLRDIMDMIEIPFKGRVVTYPACHYMNEGLDLSKMAEGLCVSLKAAGFRYVIVATPRNMLQLSVSDCDLWIGPKEDESLPTEVEVSNAVRLMWSGQAT